MAVGTRASEEKSQGRCVLVSLQLDGGNGREVLNWALGKVAGQGDRVVAVHVCRNSDPCGPSTLSLIRVLDDDLAIYEGICNLKQLVLVGRVSRGSSVRRVLVREAELCAATAVVVGVSRNYPFGSSTSLAKYCAKKLPPTTALIAVHKGRIIFERGPTEISPGGESRPILRTFLHPSISADPKFITPSREVMSDIGTPRISDVSYGDSIKGEVSNDHYHLLHERIAEGDPSSISVLVRKLPDGPGWPLLRRAVLTNREDPKDGGAREMTVVQWAMNLPDRSSPSIHQHNLDKDGTSASTGLSKELERVLRANSSSCKWFQYEELQSSTSHFSSDNLIGKGGSSRVYEGCFSGGQKMAIKLSKLTEETSRDFLLEVDIITNLKHDRIVPLLGICIEDTNLISLYSYFCKGSLEENLHGKRAKPPLPWDMRLKVAIGVAEGLNYLHNGCSRPVIHRDVKSSNILLSDEFEPQLSDFGLALWAPTTSSPLTHSDVHGTFGYLAPEYFMYGKISDKVDVYAFGVVLLELLTGREAINNKNPKGEESLVIWATPILAKGDVMEILDPNLESYDEDQMRRMALAASLCLTKAACLRPAINQVLGLLRGEEELEKWMNSRTGCTPNDPDEDAYPGSSIGSHLCLLLDLDDNASISSLEPHHQTSLEEYLRGRCSRSSSFD